MEENKKEIRIPIGSISLVVVVAVAASSLYQYFHPKREILPSPPPRVDSCTFSEGFNYRPRDYQKNVLELKLTPMNLSSGAEAYVSGCEFKTMNRDNLFGLLDAQFPGPNKIYYLDENSQMISDSAVQTFRWNNAGFGLTSYRFVVPTLDSTIGVYAHFDFPQDSIPSYVRVEMDKDMNGQTLDDKQIIGDIPIVRSTIDTEASASSITPVQQQRLPSGQVAMCVYDEEFDPHPPINRSNFIKIVVAPEENPNTLEDFIVTDCTTSTYPGVSTYSNPFNFYSTNIFNSRKGDSSSFNPYNLSSPRPFDLETRNNFVKFIDRYGEPLLPTPTTRFEWDSNLVSLDGNRYLVPERDSSMTIYMPHRACATHIVIERNPPSELGIGSFSLAVPIQQREDVVCLK